MKRKKGTIVMRLKFQQTVLFLPEITLITPSIRDLKFEKLSAAILSFILFTFSSFCSSKPL